MRVDAHHHVWRLERGDYGWLQPMPQSCPDLSRLHARRSAPVARCRGISMPRCWYRRHRPSRRRAICSTSRSASQGLVRGVVGWVDLAAPDAPATLSALAANPLLKSIRPMLQDLDDPAWILRADVQPALSALPAAGPALRCAGDAAGIAAIVVDARTPPGPRRRDRPLREARYRGAAHGSHGPMIWPRSPPTPGRAANSPGSSPRRAAPGRPMRCGATSITSWNASAAIACSGAATGRWSRLPQLMPRGPTQRTHCSPGSPKRIETRFAAATRGGSTR